MPAFARLPIPALLFGLVCAPAIAADSGPPPAPVARSAPADPLAAARGHIQAKNWANAIEELKRVDASGSADWNNLMGYAMRKQTTPDLDASQRYYDAALRIDPKHMGTLEYSGELALMKGDLPTAEARLAALSQLCNSPCETLDELKKAIANYKAGGKSTY